MIRWAPAVMFLFGLSGTTAYAEEAESRTLLHSAGLMQESPALREGAVVTVRLKETLVGGRVPVGKPVALEIASDVLAPNGRDVILKAGASVTGTVTQSGRAGTFGKAGKLAIACDYATGSDGVKIPLRPLSKTGRIRSAGRNSSIPAALTGVVVCLPTTLALEISINGLIGERGNSPAPVIIGTAAGVLAASFWRGGSATLKEGRLFNVEVAADTRLAVR